MLLTLMVVAPQRLLLTSSSSTVHLTLLASDRLLMLLSFKTEEFRSSTESVSPSDVDCARFYLAVLPPHFADDYDTWVKVGMALRSVDDYLKVQQKR